MSRVFTILILFSFALESLSLEASTVLSTSKRLSMFVSGWSQGYTLTQSGDYIAPNSIVINSNNFNFTCPGGSFLVGMDTVFESGARRFRFACSFFQNTQGNLISKTTASCNSTGWDNKLLSPGASTCTASQFIAGLNGLYNKSTKTTGAAEIDEQYKAVCCTATSPDQSTVSPGSCGALKTLNPAFGSSGGLTMCDANMVFQQISTIFQVSGTQADRIITYKCCSLLQN